MMTLSNVTTTGARKYYESANGEYYDQDAQTTFWYGKISEDLNLVNQKVDLDVFENLIQGKSPEGQALVVNAGLGRRGGLDLTFAAPKSVSLLALENPLYRQLHVQAIKNTLDYLESEYLQTRTKIDGFSRIERTSKMIVATFEHHTNRNQDPHLHTHCVLMNLTEDHTGKIKSLHNDSIYLDQKLIGMVYRAEMARQLTLANIPIEITDRQQGFFEVKGIGQEVLDLFSSRSAEIKIRAEELRPQFPNASEARLKEMANLDTRVAKTPPITNSALKEHTNQILWQQGLNVAIEYLHPATDFHKIEALSSREILQEAIKGIEENHSAWRRQECLDHAFKLGLGTVSANDLQQQFAQLTQEKVIVNCANRENYRTITGYYASREMIQLEQNIVNQATQKYPAFQVIFNPMEINHYLEKGNVRLTNTQQQAINLILTTPDRFVGIQGDAGSGKTFALQHATALWQQKGVEVIGLAPTGKAALELQTQAKIFKCSTVDSFLAQKENPSVIDFSRKATPKVWVIDEAGMLGARKMEKIFSHAISEQAKVVLVGDQKQFQSIEQGKIFADLRASNLIKFAEMNEVLRQQTSSTKEVVSCFNQFIKDGNNPKHLTQAMDLLQKEGKLITTTAGDYQQIKSDYLASMGQGKSAIIITATNLQRQILNGEIRQEMQAQKLLSAQEYVLPVQTAISLAGKERMYARNYQIGQAVIVKSKLADIAPGSRGEIMGINQGKNEITINVTNKADGRQITAEINLGYYQNGGKLETFNKEERPLAVGEKIVFFKNDRLLGVKNGQLGTVKEVTSAGNIVAQINQQEVRFNLKGEGLSPHYRAIDHAYALTGFKAQGATVDHLFWQVNAKSTNFHEAYVAVTRPREEIKIYTDNAFLLTKNICRLSEKTSTLELQRQRQNQDQHQKINNPQTPSLDQSSQKNQSDQGAKNIFDDRIISINREEKSRPTPELLR